MSDLKKYIANRKKTDKAFAENFEKGYEQFKIGVVLQARESAGLTQRNWPWLKRRRSPESKTMRKTSSSPRWTGRQGAGAWR